MSWILILLQILELVLPLILKWLQSSEPTERDVREWCLICRDAVGKIELAGLKNAVQRKRFAKVKALYSKVQDAATKRGVAL